MNKLANPIILKKRDKLVLEHSFFYCWIRLFILVHTSIIKGLYYKESYLNLAQKRSPRICNLIHIWDMIVRYCPRRISWNIIIDYELYQGWFWWLLSVSNGYWQVKFTCLRAESPLWDWFSFWNNRQVVAFSTSRLNLVYKCSRRSREKDSQIES